MLVFHRIVDIAIQSFWNRQYGTSYTSSEFEKLWQGEEILIKAKHMFLIVS